MISFLLVRCGSSVMIHKKSVGSCGAPYISSLFSFGFTTTVRRGDPPCQTFLPSLRDSAPPNRLKSTGRTHSSLARVFGFANCFVRTDSRLIRYISCRRHCRKAAGKMKVNGTTRQRVDGRLEPSRRRLDHSAGPQWRRVGLGSRYLHSIYSTARAFAVALNPNGMIRKSYKGS